MWVPVTLDCLTEDACEDAMHIYAAVEPRSGRAFPHKHGQPASDSSRGSTDPVTRRASDKTTNCAGVSTATRITPSDTAF